MKLPINGFGQPTMGAERIRIARFAVTGMLNAGVDWLIFFVLTVAFDAPLALAQGLSYLGGLGNSLVINSMWVFRGQAQGIPRGTRILRFGVAVGLSTGITTLMMQALSGWWQLPLVPAKLVVSLSGTALNYVLFRGWVFKRVETDTAKLV